MKTNYIILVVLLLLLIIQTAQFIRRDLTQWNEYKRYFKKNYPNAAEEKLRREIFEERIKSIRENNKKFLKGEVTTLSGINELSDRRVNELTMPYSTPNFTMSVFENMFGNVRLHKREVLPNRTQNLPTSLNWVEQGAVTDVEYQGDCGACWAFSVVGVIEAQYFKKTGKLISFSKQELVDCSGTGSCKNGKAQASMNYVKKNRGLNTASVYPYEDSDKNGCRKQSEKINFDVELVQTHENGDEEEMKIILATVGPISISMFGLYKDFNIYKNGIIDRTDCLTGDINHIMLLVGYGTENGTDYWLVKNSWGKSWGEEGYVKFARNKGNMCKIASLGVYVQLKAGADRISFFGKYYIFLFSVIVMYIF